jgi:hypothetical protein
MDLSRTRSSSETNTRLRLRGVRSPTGIPGTGQLDLVQKGLGMGTSGSVPRYTSRRWTIGMSLGPPTCQVYLVSHGMPSESNPEASRSLRTARATRRAEESLPDEATNDRRGIAAAKPGDAVAPRAAEARRVHGRPADAAIVAET